MMFYLLITPFFLVLYYAFTRQFIGSAFIVTIGLGVLLSTIAIIIYDLYVAYQHPLRKRIMHHKKNISSYHAILNLSQSPMPLSTQDECFTIEYQSCLIKGYTINDQFYLYMHHPQNRMKPLSDLWREIIYSAIKFKSICLCINPRQLKHLSNALNETWAFIPRILKRSQQTTLLINDEQLNQTMYYAKEFGDIGATLHLSPQLSLLNCLQQLQQQIDPLIHKAFKQKNELCTYPPIDPEQKQTLFNLTQDLTDLKPKLLESIAVLLDKNIPIKTIFIGQDPYYISETRKHPYQQYFPAAPLILTLCALGLLTVKNTIHYNVSQSLENSQGIELTKKLYQLNHKRSFKSLKQKHLLRLQSAYLAKNAQSNDYRYLLSAKIPLNYKRFLINHLTEETLDEHLLQFLAQQWIPQKHDQEPSLSDLAPLTPSPYLSTVCQLIDAKVPNCITTLEKIKNYQAYEKKLNNIEQTLIPLGSHEQMLRQLSYLAQNPRLIGQEALKTIEQVLIELSQDGPSPLITKAKDIQSMIHLLKSSHGQYILQKLHKMYCLASATHTPFEAHQIMQAAYSSENHPFRALKELQ